MNTQAPPCAHPLTETNVFHSRAMVTRTRMDTCMDTDTDTDMDTGHWTGKEAGTLAGPRPGHPPGYRRDKQGHQLGDPCAWHECPSDSETGCVVEDRQGVSPWPCLDDPRQCLRAVSDDSAMGLLIQGTRGKHTNHESRGGPRSSSHAIHACHACARVP